MKAFRFVVLFFVLSSVGFGQVRSWVSATGLDSNPCSRDFPCRSFAAGIATVGSGGEVVAMDSGGYGPVTIPKAVSLIAAKGVHAAIAPSSGNAITVSAGSGDHVVLRNLYFNSQGADNGVEADTGAALYLESCVFHGFASDGILFDSATPGARLYVSDTVIRRCGNSGIHMFGGTATLDSVKLHDNFSGFLILLGAQATIRKSVASGSPTRSGFYADSNSKVNVENSISTNNEFGFFANGGPADSTRMTITRCAATSNTLVGIYSVASGTEIYVSDSTIAANATGVLTSLGAIYSRRTNTVTPLDPADAMRGNNTLQANGTNGTFTGVVNAN